MPDADHFVFFAINKTETGSAAFAAGKKDYVDGVVESWRKGERPTQPLSLDKPNTAPDFTHESALTEALAQAVDFGLAQHQLIMVTNMAPSVFRTAMALQQVIEPTIQEAQLLSEDDQTALYGLNQEQYFRFIQRQSGYEQLKSGVAALPAATLMSVVATFDTLIVDTLAKMLKIHKDWLLKSEKTIPISRLKSAADLDELLADAIAEELYQFSRGSHDEQAKYIETSFGVNIRKYWKRWPDYIEVFERRNLVAHGERCFNKRYVSICTAAGHKGSDKTLGTDISLSAQYLRQALNILIEFAVLLPFSLWRKLRRDQEDEAFSNLNEAAFKLITNGKYVPAERICDFALSLEKTGMSEKVRQMLVVNRASSLRHLGKEEQANEVLKQVDWSASSDIFQVCVASVRGDAKEVSRLLPLVQKSGNLSARGFRDWPCFAFVREDGEVQRAFEEAFGEPLAAPSSSNTEPAAAQDSDVVEAGDTSERSTAGSPSGTVH